MAVIHRALCTWFVVQIFLVLLALRLDGRVRWSWLVVFVPVWLHDAAMLTSLVVKVATGCKNAPEVTTRRAGQYAWCLTACLLKIAFQVMLCIRLEGLLEVPIYYMMAPLWVFLVVTICDLARELRRGRVAA